MKSNSSRQRRGKETASRPKDVSTRGGSVGAVIPPGAVSNKPRSSFWEFGPGGKVEVSSATSFISGVLTLLSYILTALTFPLSLLFTLKVVKEYERAVIFRLGRLVAGGATGPGIFFILPCIDWYRKIDLRVVSFDVPPQEILSKDSVTVSVDAVIYFRISNPTVSVTNVNDCFYSTKLLAQTTLRNVLGTKTLGEMLADREHTSHMIQSVLDEATEAWGVKVERVEVKDIRLPNELMRAMAAEAEADREARAKVVAAEGEKRASHLLKNAAQVLNQNSAALQLRYLQALSSIAAEHNSTIFFPLPIDMSIFAEDDMRAEESVRRAARHEADASEGPARPQILLPRPDSPALFGDVGAMQTIAKTSGLQGFRQKSPMSMEMGSTAM